MQNMKMTNMDPWAIFDKNEESACHESSLAQFEDNFQPTLQETLPDSKEYLARLEAKLNKIKSDPNVLRQLQERREACMLNLLNGAYEDSEILDLNTPIENSNILRTIAPHRQALTQGELVELVKYDQLVEEEAEESPKTQENT